MPRPITREPWIDPSVKAFVKTLAAVIGILWITVFGASLAWHVGQLVVLSRFIVLE